MPLGSYFAFAALTAVALVGCLDDADESLGTSKSAVEPPAPESSELWLVSTNDPECDHYLRTTCPRPAVACLVNAECAALFSCRPDCDAEQGDQCFADCRKAHPAPWKLLDPLDACAMKEPACRR